MVIADVDLTPTQQRMLELLLDEKPHNRFALQKCLRDELGSVNGIKPHLSNLRKKIQSHGYGISCDMMAGENYYRLVHFASLPVE